MGPQPERAISSLELAKLCGVSQGTVDRALHDRPGISAATRERVLAAARRYGYCPNPAARELLTGRRTAVGAVVPARGGAFFSDLLEAVRAALAADGYRFFITPYAGESEFAELLRDHAARRAKAVVLVPPAAEAELPPEVARSCRAVSLVAPARGAVFVSPDEAVTGRAAAEYLCGKGHRKLAHLTYARRSPAVELRREGCLRRCRELGAECRVCVGAGRAELESLVREWGATAVFAHNDWLALSAIRICAEAGLRVPDDCSVLGVDNSPSFTEIAPGIATMQYPYAGVAAAVRALVAGKEPGAVEDCYVVERYTVRDLAAG